MKSIYGKTTKLTKLITTSITTAPNNTSLGSDQKNAHHGDAVDHDIKKPSIRHLGIFGNVSVGKTTVFNNLCKHSERMINIPGSKYKVTWGMLALGSESAPRFMRRQCSNCHSGSLFGKQDHCCDGRTDTQIMETSALKRLKSLHKKAVHVYDTPGSATLAANDEDEMVTRDLILSGRLTNALVVLDAKNLRRSLALALEIGDFGLPMLLNLNMVDEAETMGVDVNENKLSEVMHLPIVSTVAVEKRGIHKLAETLPMSAVSPKRAIFPSIIEDALEQLQALFKDSPLAPRGLGLLLLSGDKAAQNWVRTKLGRKSLKSVLNVVEETQKISTASLKEVISKSYYKEAERISERVSTVTNKSPSLLIKFGHLSQHPIAGTIIALFVLMGAYLWIGKFGATFIVDSLNSYVFNDFLLPHSASIVAHIPSEFVRDAILDPDFGLLPTGLFLALGLVLPVLFCFYLMQGILEDSGYLPRLAVLFDKIFRKLGLNGQSLIPMILGFSCITMAVITTRMLPTKKERIILTLLLMLGIPCAPLLVVMLAILEKMPWTAGAFVFGVIATQTLLIGYLASLVIPGRHPDLIMEIPRMRIPRPYMVLAKTWHRTFQFMKEAIPIFLLASFLVFVIDRLGGLIVLKNVLRPFVNGVLGLPDQFVQVMIKTAIRRENGAAELDHLSSSFSNVQLVIAMIVMVLLIPCINSTIVIIKERGIKIASMILVLVAVWALVIGALANFVCRNLGITFT